MSAVQLLDKKFSIAQLLTDINTRVFSDADFSQEQYDKLNQVSLRKSESGWFDGVGSLYDAPSKSFINTTDDFSKPNEKLIGTYVEQVIHEVEDVAQGDGVKIGRIRLMRLQPRTCYTLHKDPEEFRYHIPLITSWKSFFAVDDIIYRMEKAGHLYKFKTSAFHTAVNASKIYRLHIVFDTY